MPFRRVPVGLLALCLLVATLSSCLSRRRVITRTATTGKSAPKLLVADEASLVARIAAQYDSISDFSATVDLVPALGSTEKSDITEYKDFLGYIRFRKPADIRLIGLYPVVRSRAFDMVSNGTDFKLYVAARDRFIIGKNEIEKPSENKLENLRPQHFLDALMVRPVDPKTEKVLLENLTDEDQAFYIIHVIHESAGGELQLSRTVWFNRLDLSITRQIISGAPGTILTDARYSQWKLYDNIPFPSHIDINRPQDEYAVVIDIVKLEINKGIPSDQFVLDQPEGSTLQVVGSTPGRKQ